MAEKVRVEFDLTLGAERVHVDIKVPAGPVPARRLLPLLQGLTHQVIDAAVNEVGQRGEQVSCKAGCGACCRQLVAISENEARHLADLVGAMPEPRRTAVQARFGEARARIEAAGMLDAVRDIDALPETEGVELNRRYMKLGIACPFLEDESCSIHPQRPLVCREYLVTSAPEHCAELSTGQVRIVPLLGHVSRALVALESHDGRHHRVALVQALDWADAHQSQPPQQRTSAEWIDGMLRVLTGKTAFEEGEG
jgi:Fe-S-cluster containining protein